MQPLMPQHNAVAPAIRRALAKRREAWLPGSSLRRDADCMNLSALETADPSCGARRLAETARFRKCNRVYANQYGVNAGKTRNDGAPRDARTVK
jgi:hypothetical protein